MEEMFAAARRASGLTASRAAMVCGLSRPTFAAREAQPGGFRLDELRAMAAEMDDTGRELLLRAVSAYVFEG